MVYFLVTTYQKVQKIESLYKAIDKEIKNFKQELGIECKTHCSKCCEYDDIQANPLEFIPFAYHAHRLGQLDEWFDKIEAHDSKKCIFHVQENGKWGCKIYPVRGLICRIFGFSATTSKTGAPQLASCNIIKGLQPDHGARFDSLIKRSKKIPTISSLYKRLEAIDPTSGNACLPINKAIQKSLEKVYFYFSLKS